MIESANPENEGLFLSFKDGEFKTGKASDKNGIFEMVSIGVGNYVAVRAAGNGSGGKSDAECYLGFASDDSLPTCYSSTDFAATRFVVFT